MRSGLVGGSGGESIESFEMRLNKLMGNLQSAGHEVTNSGGSAIREGRKQALGGNYGFSKSLPDNKSPAVRAAQAAREAVGQAESWLMGAASVALLAALLWGALWAYTQSDYVLGRLSEIHVPQSMRLMKIPTAGEAVQASQEFLALQGVVLGWTEGYLGKALGLSAFLIGVGMGIVKQSIVAPMVGIVMALTMSMGPMVIGELTRANVPAEETAIGTFERTRDLEALRKGLAKQVFENHQVSYVMGQAIVMEAGEGKPTEARKQELLGHIDVVRKGLASGAFFDGQAHAVYAMEVAGYGRGITGDAAGIENFASIGRRIAGASGLLGGFILMQLSLCLALAILFAGRVVHARELEAAADPATHQRAAEKLRLRMMGHANEVPFVKTSDSSDIERLIRGIEVSGVMAAKKASGG